MCYFGLGRSTTHAQNQTNHWLFCGSYHLDFGSGYPEIVPETYTFYQYHLSAYPTSVMSDENGNLLFYTNSKKIWIANHDTMMNAGDLIGEASVSQTIIVPRPNYSNRYYVFTPGYLVGPAPSSYFRYTEVDMELNNGLGAALNFPNSTEIYSPATGKVTAVSHRNGLDIWVLSHQYNSNAFRAYLITEDGLNLQPIISNCGASHTEPIPGNGLWNGVGKGEMKFSTDGKRIAYASKGLNLVEVFDFNNETGIVSNPVSIPIPNPFSVEFSPDGTLLYIGQEHNNDSVTNWEQSVYQVDLLAGSNQNI